MIPSAATLKREKYRLPEPIIPAEPIRVDVVVPFWAGDRQWLNDCLRGLSEQNHAEPVVHVIADGCDFPPLSASVNVRRYTHNEPPGQGPYRLANALVRHGHCQTEYLAIQDADDISLPDRLWRQVQLLRQTGAQMVSSAAENFAESEAYETKARRQRLVNPAVRYPSVPRGRCVNTLRMVTVDLFRRINGFADLRCSGDFEFDNRAAFFPRTRVLHDFEVMGLRRLHGASLSHGIAPMKSPAREKDHRLLFAHLATVTESPERAPEFGALQTSFPLQVV